MPLVDDLKAALRTSMRSRDRPVTDALRSVLGDLANAEAIAVHEPSTPPPAAAHAQLAGTTAGVGATEAPRREVTADEQRAIVTEHRAELLAHAERLTRLCRQDEADGVRRAATVLARMLDAAN